MKGLLTGEGLRFLPSSVPGPARHKTSGGKGEGVREGPSFEEGPSPRWYLFVSHVLLLLQVLLVFLFGEADALGPLLAFLLMEG